MDKDSVIYTIIFSFIVTFIFVAGLAFVNIGTLDIVDENAQLASARAVLEALNISFDPTNRDEVFSKYESFTANTTDGLVWYEAEVSGETLYALRTNGAGLWGNIELVVGFNRDVDRFVGLEIVEHNETPGLGGRITEQWFKDQFAGQLIPQAVFEGEELTFVRAGTDAPTNYDDEKVDSITGATRTSESMRGIISTAARDMKSIVGGL